MDGGRVSATASIVFTVYKNPKLNPKTLKRASVGPALVAVQSFGGLFELPARAVAQHTARGLEFRNEALGLCTHTVHRDPQGTWLHFELPALGEYGFFFRGRRKVY